jgi:hypothetical protein
MVINNDFVTEDHKIIEQSIEQQVEQQIEQPIEQQVEQQIEQPIEQQVEQEDNNVLVEKNVLMGLLYEHLFIYIVLILIAIILSYRCNRSKGLGTRLLSTLIATLCPVFYIFYKVFGNDCVGERNYDEKSIFIMV